MADLFTAVQTFLEGILTILNVFLLPIDPVTDTVDWTLLPSEPLKLMIWFALIFAFVPAVFGFVLRAVRSSNRGSNS
jgi:hypothetical protein